jgi:hypothetical protein
VAKKRVVNKRPNPNVHFNLLRLNPKEEQRIKKNSALWRACTCEICNSVYTMVARKKDCVAYHYGEYKSR